MLHLINNLQRVRDSAEILFALIGIKETWDFMGKKIGAKARQKAPSYLKRKMQEGWRSHRKRRFVAPPNDYLLEIAACL